MRSILFLLFPVILLFPSNTCGQPRTVAFYNVENFFDTVNDPATEDGDFTADGIYRWTDALFREKTERIASVLSEIGADIVGLAEVENHSVLDSLVYSSVLRDAGYGYVHFDSPDPRGIDVAFLYRRSCFCLEDMQAVRYGRVPQYRTREMLHVSGLWRGHPVHVLVCHLPSVLSSRSVRRLAALSVGEYADSLMAADPGRLVLVMGDFNANPGSGVMRSVCGGGRLYNPFAGLFRRGYGTYHYRGRWNMYDSILVGGVVPGEVEGRVFVKDYLIQGDGQYRGYPYRSFSGGDYIGGYSDHLPVIAIIR